MIKSIIGAVVGANLAKNTKLDNGTGAIIGSVAPAVIARLSLPTMVAVGVGGYLLKRYRDRENALPQQNRAAITGTVAAPRPAPTH